MLEIYQLKVWIEPPYKNHLFWKYLETKDNLADYDLFIERSIGDPFLDAGKIQQLAQLPASENYFVDDRDVNHYRQITYYYRIKIAHKTDPTKMLYSEPSFFSILSDREVLTIIEHELMYLRQYVSRKVYLFKKKKEGPRCICYDYYRQESTNSECDECMGVGFYGGYYGPFEIYMQFRPIQRTEQRDQTHVEHAELTAGWTAYSIQIEPGDVIVDVPLGQVMIVQTVQFTEWHRHPVKQNVQVLRPNRSDPSYGLLKKFNRKELMSS